MLMIFLPCHFNGLCYAAGSSVRICSLQCVAITHLCQEINCSTKSSEIIMMITKLSTQWALSAYLGFNGIFCVGTI